MLRPCTTSAGFMAVPDKQRKLRLGALKDALAADGFEIVLDARILLLVRRGTESTIYDTGKVLLKTTDKDEAETAYAAMRPHIEAFYT